MSKLDEWALAEAEASLRVAVTDAPGGDSLAEAVTMLFTELRRQRQVNAALLEACKLARSIIKSGEPWTPQAAEVIEGAIRQAEEKKRRKQAEDVEGR